MRLMMAMLMVCVSIQALAVPAAEEAPATPLFNGKDLSGWVVFFPEPSEETESIWQVLDDGVLHCTGTVNGYVRTEAEYGEYELELEWRWVEKPGNSGVLLHITGEDKVWPKSIESQLMAGNAGDFWLIGGTTLVPSDAKRQVNNRVFKIGDPEKSNEKPVGEWNHMKVVTKDGKITVEVNGQVVNKGAEASVTKGTIGLQSEGVPIEFRSVTLRPLAGSSEEASALPCCALHESKG
jgi:hypothetical protein